MTKQESDYNDGPWYLCWVRKEMKVCMLKVGMSEKGMDWCILSSYETPLSLLALGVLENNMERLELVVDYGEIAFLGNDML